MDGLDVSLVVYRPDMTLLAHTMDTLAQAARPLLAAGRPVRLFLIDNGDGGQTGELERLAAAAVERGLVVQHLYGHGNVGYGLAHDLALLRPDGAPFHLVLNPDVELDPAALQVGLAWLEAHPRTVLLAPRATGGDGAFQSLCKRPPGLLTLALRGFAPEILRRPFRRLLDRYEMRDRITAETMEPVSGIAIASGCFMLLRGETARQVGGFTGAYFLYFEDFDFSRRLSLIGDVVYLPAMRIVHHGGGAGRKGWHHLRLFVTSALTYFRRWGWRLI